MDSRAVVKKKKAFLMKDESSDGMAWLNELGTYDGMIWGEGLVIWGLIPGSGTFPWPCWNLLFFFYIYWSYWCSRIA